MKPTPRLDRTGKRVVNIAPNMSIPTQPAMNAAIIKRSCSVVMSIAMED